MAEARVFSYRVLFFEKDQTGFVSPDRYPALSLAVAGSHDLPTLRAWMEGSDLALKGDLGLYPNAMLEEDARLRRNEDRRELLAAFNEHGLAFDPAMTLDQFAEAAHAFLADSAARITMVQIDDITRETMPVNVPTTSTEYRNWRRRLSMTLEQIADDPRFHALTRLLTEARSGSGPRAYADAAMRASGPAISTNRA